MYLLKHNHPRRITKRFLLFILMSISGLFVYANTSNEIIKDTLPDKVLLELSEQFLFSVKTGDSTKGFETELAILNIHHIRDGLNNDEAIKTFWINMYNAWFQILAGREKMRRPEIFTKKIIPIGGHSFSLDDIEHGILRRYRWKLSMGYLAKPFPRKLIKQLAVKKIDYRIHFALNCGAKSCPPIAFYSYDKINQQLDLAGKNFLGSETIINEEKKEVVTSKIVSWFKGDFGGKKGIRKILGKATGKDLSVYKIRFKKYDWETVLKNYSE